MRGWAGLTAAGAERAWVPGAGPGGRPGAGPALGGGPPWGPAPKLHDGGEGGGPGREGSAAVADGGHRRLLSRAGSLDRDLPPNAAAGSGTGRQARGEMPGSGRGPSPEVGSRLWADVPSAGSPAEAP